MHESTGQAGLFTVMVRPARSVYLIAEGSRAGFRRAVREATTRWGGACEPILEVRADGTTYNAIRQLVEFANVDGAVNVDAQPEGAEAVAKSLGLELVRIEDIDRWGTTSFTSHPSILGLSPETVDGSNGYVIPPIDSPLWQATAAGDLTAEQEADFKPGLLRVHRAKLDHEIMEAQMWGQTLLERTRASLGENWASPSPGDSPTLIWLTQDDEFTDCTDFWNLRVLRPLRFGSIPMYLLPAEVSHWTTWPTALERALNRPDRFSVDVILASNTVDAAGREAFAEQAGLVRADTQEVRRYTKSDDQTMRSAPFTYLIGRPTEFFTFSRTYGEVEYVDVPLVREKTTLRFINPVPLKPATAGMSLIRIAGDPLDVLPQRDCVVKLISHNATWRDDAVQMPEFLQRDCRLELRIPTLAAACDAILSERTTAHALSEKGAIGAGLLTEAAIDALSEPDVYEAIRQLTTPRGDAIARKLQRLFGKDQELTPEQREFATQFAGRSERVFHSADKLGHGTTVQALTALERLVDIGWAERGLETACGACGLSNFVSLSTGTARSAGTCPVCGATVAYTHNEHGLAINYRLDGRVDHANDQGVVAHLMAIGALSRRYDRTWFLPGVDLVFGDQTKGEVDLFGVCDRKLVSGEVKMTGTSFTDTQIDKDLDLATRLSVNLYVMAATTRIPDAAKTHAATRCEEHGIELLILERADLQL